MKKHLFKLFLVGFVACSLVIGSLGRIARAEEDEEEPDRHADAYEEEMVCGPFGCTYTGRQYTSEYDLMMGNIFPNVQVQYSYSNPTAAYNPMSYFMPTQSYSQGSATGGLFTGPMFSFGTSPMLGYMGSVGAPKYQTYQSSSPFGNVSYGMNYAGFGGGGFVNNPFGSTPSMFGNIFGGFGGFGSSYGGFGGYGGSSYGGFGGFGGGYPTVLW